MITMVYHAYMDIWTTVEGQTLLRRAKTNYVTLKIKNNNNPVVVFQEDLLVGHVPFNLAPCTTLSIIMAKRSQIFLQRKGQHRRIWT